GPPQALTARRAENLWADLAGDDAGRAHRALGALVAAPGQAVPFLRGRLAAVTLGDARRVARLIAGLESDRFEVRESAGRELERLGEFAEPALREALSGKPSLELRRRAERLLAKSDGWVRSAERLRVLRAVEALEKIGTGAARQALQAIARTARDRAVARDAGAAVERLAQRAVVSSQESGASGARTTGDCRL